MQPICCDIDDDVTAVVMLCISLVIYLIIIYFAIQSQNLQ